MGAGGVVPVSGSLTTLELTHEYEAGSQGKPQYNCWGLGPEYLL